MKDKICFVVQRYGLEVNGGAELQCRLFAEHLLDKYNVDVVTTKAIDYTRWKNAYRNNEENINGVTVRRFKVERKRNAKRFNYINGVFLSGGLKPEEERQWVNEQGPYCPGLIEYIRNHKDDYKVFVFFTYLYYPTVMGLPEVAEKAILIPEAHDEPFMNMHIIRELFALPQAIFFNTEEERDFVHRKFNNDSITSDIGGIGIEEPSAIDPEDFQKKYKIENYVVYVGRIDEGKNCHILFKYFQEYKTRNNNNLKLVLIGKPVIDIPKDKDVIALGFLSEQDKINGVAGAQILILPSEFESLSMAVLEAMCVETPIMVNGKCDVLKGHCVKSNGAFYYNNYYEFEAEINYLLTHKDEAKTMTLNAKKYVDENYKWEVVTERLSNLIEGI